MGVAVSTLQPSWPDASLCMPAFLNVIGDQLTPLSAIWWPEESLFDHRDVLMAACVVVVIFPLCLLKRIEYGLLLHHAIATCPISDVCGRV